jgi:hypothetical protein
MLLVAVGLSAALSATAQPTDPVEPPTVEAPAEPAAEPEVLAPVVAPDAPPAVPAPAPAAEAPSGEAAVTAPEKAPDAPSADDPAGLATKVLEWVMSGEYALAATAALMLLMVGLRIAVGWEMLSFLAWFRSRWGGWALNLGSSTAGAVLTGQLAGQSLSARLVLTGLLIGFAAAGGVEFFKDLKKGNTPNSDRAETQPARPPATPI